jgi:hypothetical protein
VPEVLTHRAGDSARLTRIKGWGVRCTCGFDWQPRGPRGGRVNVLKTEAIAVYRKHLTDNGQTPAI